MTYEPRSFVESDSAIAQSDYALELKANGTQIQGGIQNDVKDEFKTNGLIKITQWENFVQTSREAGTGMATGRRQYEGLHLTGPISQAAPMIFKALCDNQVVDATLKCFRLKHDGGKENHFNITLKKGRVANYLVFTSPLDGSLYYQFTLIFQTIKYEWKDGGLEHEDNWQQNR